MIDSGAFNFTGAMFRVDLDTGKTKTIFKSGECRARWSCGGEQGDGIRHEGVPWCRLYEVNLKNGDLTLLNGSGFNNPLGLDIAP